MAAAESSAERSSQNPWRVFPNYRAAHHRAAAAVDPEEEIIYLARNSATTNGFTMLKQMNFAKWVFFIAGVYGILLMTPMYFGENQANIDFPPLITHPENYYGFIGVTLAWQLAFLIISTNPERYRLLMIAAIVEKISFAAALAVLYSQDRVATLLLWFGGVDLLLATLFLVAFLRTPKTQ
ncbi:MAG TPA: hypothetical protein VJB38_15210 [Bacteroidota bacterium]|nr:hypothetical protein [Bacteroidota bacterium]